MQASTEAKHTNKGVRINATLYATIRVTLRNSVVTPKFPEKVVYETALLRSTENS